MFNVTCGRSEIYDRLYKKAKPGVYSVMHSSNLDLIDEGEERPAYPLPRILRIGSLACLVSALAFYGVAHSFVSRLQVWWMEALIFVLVPLSVTFVVLYRSCWHPDITGASRTSRLLLLSCAIVGGEAIAVFIAAVILLCLGLLCMFLVAFSANALSGGNH
jgi:hypothetical protein